MEIKIKRVRVGAKMPKKETSGSAGYDVYLPSKIKVEYGRQIVPMGWSISMPPTLTLDSRTRAGYAAKGLAVADENGEVIRIDADVILGLIDSDYRNEMGVIVNVRDTRVFDGNYYFLTDKPISQMKFCVVPDTELVEVDDLDETDRGMKGFGAANGE